MGNQYRELFHIDCLHSYFADGRCRTLELRPTVECSRLLERYQCLFRPYEGGGAVYYSERDGQSSLRHFDEVSPFAFALRSTDPGLVTYTEVETPRSPSDSLHYFSNLKEDTMAGGALPVRPPQFVRTIPRAQLTNALRGQIWNPDGPLPEVGRYTLSSLDPPGTNYDIYLSNLSALAHWGVVEIFAGGPAQAPFLAESNLVVEAGGTLRPQRAFTISLNACKSIWRYYIVSQSSADRSFGDAQIIGNAPGGKQPPVTFSTPVQQKIDGKDAWVFESAAAISLCEVPGGQHEFTLKPNGRNGAGARSVALPYGKASSTRLEVGPDGKARMCSEMFVYL